MTDGSVHRGRKPLISREQVLDEAASALASGGVDAVSLRAIARQLGVVSSAIYRHYPSRDALLTDLITQSYVSLGEWVTDAEASVERSDLTARLAAIVHGTREWARLNPHRYALVYGTPVPGYQAPRSTIEPASVLGVLLARLLTDAVAAGQTAPRDPALDAVSPLFAPLADALGIPQEESPSVAAGVEVWSQLFGHVTFELFGHYTGVIGDVDAYTEFLIARLAARLGLAPPSTSPIETTATRPDTPRQG